VRAFSLGPPCVSKWEWRERILTSPHSSVDWLCTSGVACRQLVRNGRRGLFLSQMGTTNRSAIRMSRGEVARLNSWKEIADYLERDVRTAVRWEKKKGLPIHRIPGGRRRAIFAYRGEIDAWLLSAEKAQVAAEPARDGSACMEDESSGLAMPDGPANGRSGGETRLGTSRIAGLAGLAGLLALALIFLAVRRPAEPRAATLPAATEPTAIPSEIEHWLRIDQVNGEPVGIAGAFEQRVVVDSAKYAAFEAEELHNIEFFDRHGKILPSWLESGKSSRSTRTVYWVRCPGGVAARSLASIYMGFAAKTRNLLNGTTTGEAPTLSRVYAQYDDGPAVFLRYANFAGTSLPRGWRSGITPGGRGMVRVNNGVLLSHAGGDGSAFLGSDWAEGDNVVEMALRSAGASARQGVLEVCPGGGSRSDPAPSLAELGNERWLAVENRDAAPASILAVRLPQDAETFLIGLRGGMVFEDYKPVAQVRGSVCDNGYLISIGSAGSFSLDWVRLRAGSPNGVMPATVFGKLK
jgi:hypothetical protein